MPEEENLSFNNNLIIKDWKAKKKLKLFGCNKTHGHM
jgi:hypothetical protein